MANKNGTTAMRAVEYTARVLPSGHLELPADIRQELQLRPSTQVRVIIMRGEEAREQTQRLEAERAEVFRQIAEIRQQLSGKEGSLTDALLQAREEEDASL